MFFQLNSFDESIDISRHPKFQIVVNNVSKYGDTYDPETIEKDPESAILHVDPKLSPKNRILQFKESIFECVKNFYLSGKVSDSTKIGGK